jgi:hypothetical protein
MDAVIRQPRGSAVMITIEVTEDEALSLRNLLDVAVRHEGMRAAIFAVTVDAKGHTENPVLGSVQKSNRYKGRIVFDYAY